jgi:uncharacterized membrane protein HdeD (DUF308 family)
MATAPHFGVAPGTLGEVALDELRSTRRWLMASGVLSIIAGLLAFLVPTVASVSVAIFLGAMLVVGGVAIFVGAIATRRGGRAVLNAIVGVLTFLAGLYLLAAPLRGTFTLTVMLVLWFVVSGTLRVALGLAEWGVPGSGWTVFNGVVTLILGLLIAESLPSSADWAIGLLVGIDLVFYGTGAVLLAASLKRLEPGQPPPAPR